MTIYLIKENKEFESYNNVIEWKNNYVIYKAGKGTGKIYAGENEYFTDQEPLRNEENEVKENEE